MDTNNHQHDNNIQITEALKPCFNAVKHGILKQSITPYEQVDYVAIYNELEEQFKPSIILEKMTLERIVLSYIKLARIGRAESELMLKELTPEVVKGYMEPLKCGEVIQKGYVPEVSLDVASKLDIYSRYETSAENRMYKAIAVLMNLKNNPIQR